MVPDAENSQQTPPRFLPKPGDVVFTRTALEIAATLDSNGCVDGLPFMPEMLAFCGQKFRVQRQANKSCVNAETVYIGSLTDCFVLAMPQRCDGCAHGGCQMGCKFFWRSEWLCDQPCETGDTNSQLEDFRSRLESFAKKSESSFRCQATELVNIVSPTSALKMDQYLKDIATGVPAQQVIRFLAGLAIKKVLRKPDHLSGPCRGGTPVQKLDLKEGEKVRVKSIEAIRETLDLKGLNRGLWFDKDEMVVFCGKELVVSRVLNRLIDEKSGQLKELKNPCIVLSESECSGVFRRFCSRGMLHFWREIWLERVD